MTKMACLEKAQQLFPTLKSVDEAIGNETKNTPEPEPDMGKFRMVSTGKFIWDWTLPSPATGKLTCIGDFNTRRIETINYNGIDKRPDANDVWEISSQPMATPVVEAVTIENMEDLK